MRKQTGICMALLNLRTLNLKNQRANMRRAAMPKIHKIPVKHLLDMPDESQ
jgi:hypothetical protein